MIDKIDGVMVRNYIGDTWVASLKELALLIKIDARTLERYVAKGMEKHEKSLPKFTIVPVVESILWIREYAKNKKTIGSAFVPINKNVPIPTSAPIMERLVKKEDIEVSERKSTTKTAEEVKKSIEAKITDASEMLNIEDTSFDEADRVKKIMEALEKTLKVGEMSKGLISSSDARNAMLELMAMISRSLKRLSRTIPKECCDTSEEYISAKVIKILKDENDNLKKILKGKVSKNDIVKYSDIKFMDIFDKICENLESGSTLEDEMLKLKG